MPRILILSCVCLLGRFSEAHNSEKGERGLPVINPFSFPNGLQEGQQIDVLCAVIQGNRPLTFTWLKDGRELPKDIQVVEFKESVHVLTIDKLRAEHSGNYTCSVSGPFGKTEHSAFLLVNTPVRWMKEPINHSAKEGSSFVLQCSASGTPPPVIVWRKIFPGPQKSEWQTISNKRLRIMANGGLAIDGATHSDRGQYKCQASNEAGHYIEKVITLTIHEVEIHLTWSHLEAKEP